MQEICTARRQEHYKRINQRLNKMNKSRIDQALEDLNIETSDFSTRARELSYMLVGYSLFWGTNDNGEAYIEWYDDKNHSIALTRF